MVELTEAEKGILEAVAVTHHNQETTEGVLFNPANQEISLLATGQRTKDAILRLVTHGLLYKTGGFKNGYWVGYPGLVDEEGVPLEQEANQVANKTTTKAKGNNKSKSVAKAKVKPKSRALSLAGIKPDDFFNTDGKNTVFKAGWDAKLSAMFKRIANGKGSSDDLRLLKAKTLTDHAKVTSSKYLKPLRDEAVRATL